MMRVGGKIVFIEKFNGDSTLEALPFCTLMMGVPTIYRRLLNSHAFNHENCQHMRLFISGSAPLSPELFNQFVTQTGHTILERYGMTESGINFSNPLDGERIPGSVGFALPGLTFRIVDRDQNQIIDNTPGMLQIKSKSVTSGYWQNPQATTDAFTSDGYFITGDIATQDVDGRVSLVGRASDLIISGGMNVYPREIENILNQHPEIIESAVIGLPCGDFGEVVTAVIVTKTTVDGAQLKSLLKKKLANYKIPKTIHTLNNLPRNAMGKVQKHKLRRLLENGLT